MIGSRYAAINKESKRRLLRKARVTSREKLNILKRGPGSTEAKNDIFGHGHCVGEPHIFYKFGFLKVVVFTV